MSRWVSSLLAISLISVSVVGLLDAAFVDEHDVAVLFALAVLIGAAQLAIAALRPRGLVLRPDVTRWLVERSQLTGEPVEHLAERALTTYRVALGEDEDGHR